MANHPSRTSSKPANSPFSSSEYRGGTTRSSSKARSSRPPSSSSKRQHDRSRSRPSSNSRRQHENDRSRPRSSASHGISKVRSCSSSGRFQHGSGTSRQHHVNGRSRQRSGKSSSNYYSSQHSVSTRTTESSSQSGRFTRSVVRSIGNGSVSSIASKLLKRKKTNRTIDLYDKNELAKAWHRERAQSKRRELKARTPSPDTTEESSDCSSEDDETKSFGDIVGLDAETAWKSISCEETEEPEETTSDEGTYETKEEEEEQKFDAENKFVAACEKTLHTPLQGFLVFVDWWNGVCE